MVPVDRVTPIRFLRTAYNAADWIAVFLKTYRTGDVAQRVMPVSAVLSQHFQAWLRHRNANGWNVYVSVNAVVPGRSRTRRSIAAVRHVFVEEDSDGPGLLAALTTRPDLPPPSYVLHSSPGRLHVLWRTRHFERDDVEALQKRLARELDTDSAATSCAQTTRLPLRESVAPAPARPRRVSLSGNRAARRLSRSDASFFQRDAWWWS
jgi:hypothetical protein